MDELLAKFRAHKASAQTRGIEFDLTFEDWKDIWGDRIDLRGTKSGQFGMLRTRDEGGYTKGNVRIGTAKENAQEAAVAKKVKAAGVPKNPEYRPKPPTAGSWLSTSRNPFKPYVEEDEEEYQ